MTRLPLAELERRCQKPAHRRIGNWMARRISRPLALRVTWVLQPWGVSAHAVTFLALLTALAAAIAFACGTSEGWLLGAALLQLWYLLDHVDGQLARMHGTASLDGVQLDYLMHHAVNLIVPWGIGFGVAGSSGSLMWMACGLAWSLGLLMIGLLDDTRYKAFVERLKNVEGELLAAGGGGCRNEPAPPAPRQLLKLVRYLFRKVCEIHVIVSGLTLLVGMEYILADQKLLIGRVYLALMALVSLSAASGALIRSLNRGDAEREFAAWYQPPAGTALTFEEGRWRVRADE